MQLINIFLMKFYSLFLFISEGGEKKDTLLSVEPGLMIWTIIIFVILVFILKKFAWKPLLDSLRNREKGIRDSIEHAEKMREEAEKILQENKKLLAEADAEARKSIAEGKALAEKLRNELVEKANQQSAHILQQAKTEIEREKQTALNQLKDEIGNLAIQAAGKIIDENLNEAKHKKLIESFINQLPKN